jgi:hypothetical protein
MIFIDINKRMKEYDEVIQDDLNEMNKLGMQSKMADINAELAKKMAGHVNVEAGDEQIMGEAFKLKPGEF